MSAYPPLPVNTQKVKSWGPKTAAARTIGAANAAPSAATERQRRTRHARNASGSSVTAAVCLVSVASASVAPAAAGRRADAEQHRRGHDREHEHLEVRGLRVGGAEGGGREQVGAPGEDGREPPPEPAAGLRGQQQRGEGLCDHGHDADRCEIVGAGEPEHRRVEVRDHRRLAVHRVDVQVPAVEQDLRLGREVGLVGVEDAVGEAGRPQRGGQHEEQQEQQREGAEPAADPPFDRSRGGPSRASRAEYVWRPVIAPLATRHMIVGIGRRGGALLFVALFVMGFVVAPRGRGHDATHTTADAGALAPTAGGVTVQRARHLLCSVGEPVRFGRAERPAVARPAGDRRRARAAGRRRVGGDTRSRDVRRR